jgi:acetyltransferase-like isoleucine patch superfamily enzyme
MRGVPAAAINAFIQRMDRHGSAWDYGRRAVAMARATYIFRHCKKGPGVLTRGKVEVYTQGRIEIGPRCAFLGGMISTELRCAAGGTLSVGADTLFNYGTIIDCHRSIRIGNGCMFASMVLISDRSENKEGPIVIGDDVWVAHGAVISPGVTVGDGAVIAAGSVVVEDVPPRTMALGAPARVMNLSLIAPDMRDDGGRDRPVERPKDEHARQG